MAEIIFYGLGLFTGWLIFWKFPEAYGVIKDVAEVVGSWFKYVFEKITKRG